MSARITRRPAARRDVLEAAAYIAKDNIEAALRFADAVRETEELLTATPGIGTPRDFAWPELAGMIPPSRNPDSCCRSAIPWRRAL